MSELLSTIFIVILCGIVSTAVFAAKPNVIVVLTDDRGDGDSGSKGNLMIPAIVVVAP